MKYSDQLVDWLVEEGYTHCFFVAGGNIMHLLDSARTRLVCVPFVHEVGAGIAAEYFNELRVGSGGKAFALVTAGPGLTNIITAMAGAYLESRDLLVIGGQVKSSDLADDGMRQRGIQEVDGVAIAAPVTVRSIRLTEPAPRATVMDAVRAGTHDRKGPVFMEICLDAQAADPVDPVQEAVTPRPTTVPTAAADVSAVVDLLSASHRPVVLLGGGLSRADAASLLPSLTALGIPLATTWNAADRVPSDHPLYFGRPNTWGMRWANILVQQADLLIAVGTRLGMQQTGFNWQGFAPLATVVQVDIDPMELEKGHPQVAAPVRADAAAFLTGLVEAAEGRGLDEARRAWDRWITFGHDVRARLPLDDPLNVTAPGFLSPFGFATALSATLDEEDVVIPCSSGGAFTVMMQALEQKSGQLIATDKGLASMGYGLSGAIGASIAHPHRRVILVEGDGGFAQNLQELGTVAAQCANVKMFLFANDGYASIRMTQRNYFGGAYLGCDAATGLGLPQWPALFAAYGIPVRELDPRDPFDTDVLDLLHTPGPAAFIVPIDPDQTYYPKINSRVTADGGMESSPLHEMYPPLHRDVATHVMPHLPDAERT